MFDINSFTRRRQAVTRNISRDCYFKLYKNQWKDGRPFMMNSYVFNDDNNHRTYMYKGENSLLSAVGRKHTAVYIYVEERLFNRVEKCRTLLHLSNVNYDIYRMVKCVQQYIHPTSFFFLLKWDPVNVGVRRIPINHWIEDDLTLFPVSDSPTAERA